MVSVIGEEFLAYSTTSSGNVPALVPLVALFRYDNDNVEFRDLCKQDIIRIPSSSSSPALLGGWLFRLSQPAESVYNATWVKRFVIIQGEMAFFFHSPTHEKPLSMILLAGSSIVCPPSNAARFEEQLSSGNTFRANPGFEFDVRHVSRPTIRFCASSGEERMSWTNLFSKASNTDSSSVTSRPAKQSHQNSIITNIKLSGLSLLPASGVTIGGSLTSVGDNTARAAAAHKSQSNGTELENFSVKSEPPPAARQNSFTVSAASMLLLEKSLKKKVNDQEEARRREKSIRSKALSRRSVESAREMEAKNPLSLAELVRFLLFFYDEEFTDDPQQQQQQQQQARATVKSDSTRTNGVNMPHIKGVAIENVLMFVYQKYCSDTGFMSLEGFVEFMDDCSVIQTHVPRDENDEPSTEFCTMLDAVRLITLVPRNLGVSSSDTYYSSDSSSYRYMEAMKRDKFALNFNQFYQLLLRITEIVYPDLYPVDEPYAFNKFLAEVILPLFVWSNGHSKKGAQDVLVREERILLLMITYAPNLWRVFLTYAQDAVGKVPDINEPFPERAQANEKGVFKPPPFIPESILGSINLAQQSHDVHSSSSNSSLFVSESAFLRCCCDFGLSPHLSSIKQVRATYRQVCARDSSRKVIVSSRLPMPHTSVAASKDNKRITTTVQQQGAAGRQAGKDKVKSAFTTSSKPPPKKKGDGGVGSGGERESMALLLSSSSAGERSPPPPPPPETFLSNNQIGGLAFSEFCEVLARIAVDGLGRHPSFEVLFPTPFSKVLAVLTVWGLADIDRLEQVRAIHTEELVD